MLSLVSFFGLLKFIFTKRIPNSILTNSEQRRLHKKNEGMDLALLRDKLAAIEEHKYIKFSGFSTNLFGVPNKGHSMLIYKLEPNRYIFFNPDKKRPSCETFSLDELCEEMNSLSKRFDRVALIDNVEFMKRANTSLSTQEISSEYKKTLLEVKSPDESNTASEKKSGAPPGT